MKNRFLRYGGAALLALFIAGCGGDDGDPGPAGPEGPPPSQEAIDQAVADYLANPTTEQALQAVNPEQCSLCHTGDSSVARTGPNHQAIYKELYQDGIVKVVAGSMVFSTNGVDTTTLKFSMTKNGVNFDCTQADTLGSYWAQYDFATKTFTDDMSLSSRSTPPSTSSPGTVTKTYDGAGGCTIVSTVTSAADKARVAKMGGNGIVQIYGTDEIVARIRDGKRIDEGKYPFAGVLKIGTVDYASAANVSGCENCHTQPFLKHGYIYGKVTDNAGAETQFYTCKGCHYDTRTGGHQAWQLLKDDPARYAELEALVEACPDDKCNSIEKNMTAEELAKYAYKAKLMNDVHMSHNMEFAYPQRLTNCVTCHAGKLDIVLADNKFNAETCISCHSIDDPVDLTEKGGTARGPGLRTMMSAASYNHANYVSDLDELRKGQCTLCHNQTGGPGGSFKKLHKGGYDPIIYTDTGVRYSDTYKVAIDSASLGADNKLTFTFKATEAPDIADYAVSDIKPTVLIGLYGYDAKDFIVAAHDRVDGERLLEWVFGDKHSRFTGTVVGAGSWQVTVDLSTWADMIADGSVKRAEIAVLPDIKHKTATIWSDRSQSLGPASLGLNAPSRTFNLVTKAFDDNFMKYGGQFTTTDIVKVAKTVGTDGSVTGCNTCHDQLATTFHTGIRGGNIRVCRICHEVSSAGGHLELQSRSIDSYVHAIHSFQAFDPGDVNARDPVEELEYHHHTSSLFPRFGVLNCESCHNTGRYNVPDQTKSMPGVLSGTAACEDDVPECIVADRNIGTYPPAVTGPAVRACGGCHRAQKIVADDAGGLATLISHWKSFGYVVDAVDDDKTDIDEQTELWKAIVEKIMGLFKS